MNKSNNSNKINIALICSIVAFICIFLAIKFNSFFIILSLVLTFTSIIMTFTKRDKTVKNIVLFIVNIIFIAIHLYLYYCMLFSSPDFIPDYSESEFMAMQIHSSDLELIKYDNSNISGRLVNNMIEEVISINEEYPDFTITVNNLVKPSLDKIDLNKTYSIQLEYVKYNNADDEENEMKRVKNIKVLDDKGTLVDLENKSVD